MSQNLDLMKDTINDVAKSLDFEVTDAEKEEILEEIFSTDEWVAVMSRIEGMMYEKHELKTIIEVLEDKGYEAKIYNWHNDSLDDELEVTKGSDHVSIRLSDVKEMDIEELVKLIQNQMEKLNNK